MMPRRAFPRDICQDASTDELRVYMGDLLDWLAKRKRRDRMAAGFTEPELFELRRVGNAYRTDTLNPEIFAKAAELIDKLERVTVRL